MNLSTELDQSQRLTDCKEAIVLLSMISFVFESITVGELLEVSWSVLLIIYEPFRYHSYMCFLPYILLMYALKA